MRVMVLGSSGMAGRVCLDYLSAFKELTVMGLERTSKNSRKPSLKPNVIRANVKSFFDKEFDAEVKDFAPDTIINGIGVVKQRLRAIDSREVVEMNALFPHHLARLINKNRFRLINLSTDCVFDGAKGNYCEEDLESATDLYGRSKILGEVKHEKVLNLRTSLVGHETSNRQGLLEWFLSSSGSVFGYQNAFFSGLTTLELAKILHRYVLVNKEINGTLHVSGRRISKYDLLNIFEQIYDTQCVVHREDSFRIDRSLDDSKFRKLTGYNPKSWVEQVGELKRYNDSGII
ncbi:sugar nucleotide-binding protein [Alphaproteobacteria bacterium]|nr:sugar nucleotide-binding protein [Alphaproteobacteria bacterium]